MLEYAHAVTTFAERLEAARWPREVRVSVDTLVQRLATETSMTIAAAEASTLDAFLVAADKARSEDEDELAAREVRKKLGLQPNGNAEIGCVAPA